MISIDELWRRITVHSDETFSQIRGGTFTYQTTNSAIIPDRTNQNIPKAHFEQALELVPLQDTVLIQHLRGPSYIYAVLMDNRIRKDDW